ncbi:phage holin family protein [Glycomyces harbinensis]|uniref:Putative Holin-X, holin superfamily III n=1 Tax=Glycomyces harbinensis TaxID=58114 RepID=A0A1G6SNK3_9ACTN|nr:phage holin family protein [Glycomyces harbinensis]SDD18383.1 Putative Holin-X, holin superfamily III [Glycomyces harbinensis]
MEVRRDPEAQAVREAEREHRGEWADTDNDRTDDRHTGAWRRRRADWDERDRSVGRIVGDLTSEVAHLARIEAQLAAREMADKAKQGAVGGGMFAVAGAFAMYGGAAFALAAGIALALVWPAWLAALVMGVVLLAVAGIFALTGRAKLRAALPPVPGETMDRVHEDANALRGRMDR